MNEELNNIVEIAIRTGIESSKSGNFDIMNLGIAIIAIVISIIAIFISIWTVKRGEKKNYNNKYYDSILSEFLESKLPILMNNTIDRKSRTISDEDYEILDEELERFREKILVFQYINNEFYTRLDANIIELDEKLITISGKSEYFDRTYEAINKILVKIYKDVEEFLLK
jgi:hypothetical protein